MDGPKVSCRNCSSNIIKSYENEVKLRAKLVKWTSDGMFAICKGCGNDVPLPSDIMKSIQSTFKFYAKKGCSDK